jgi:glycosyltransferase involved in cell wall biosynthesis
MKIVLITGSYPPDKCGVGDYTRELANSLAKMQGAKVFVLTSCGHMDLDCDQGVVVLRCLPDWSLRSLPILLRELNRIRPHIAHIQYPTQGYGFGGLQWLIPSLARFKGVRVVQTWHERFNRRDFPKFLFMALTPGSIIVVRETWRHQFRGLIGILVRLRNPICIKLSSNIPISSLTPSEVAKVKLKYAGDVRRLIVFFGFIHPLKRIELLFDIADPATDQLIIIGNTVDQADYAERIKALTLLDRWRGRSSFVGSVDQQEAADCLKAADALILPFKFGSSEGNGSVLAGVVQGTFVLTTSTLAKGYDPISNIYYASVDDLVEMQQALKTHGGRKRHAVDPREDSFDWGAIAIRHLDLYKSLVGHHRSVGLQSGDGPA